MARFLYRLLRETGIDIRKSRNILQIPRYISDYIKYKKQAKVTSLFPCLNDWTEQSGSAGGHYFHQDLLVAQKIFQYNPKKHLDIGSRLDGFVAHVASFRKIEVIDIRPQKTIIENIQFSQGDLTNLPKKLYKKYDSVLCLHTIEHVGLGRYGDKIDHEGDIKAIANLKEIVSDGGKLYLSVPIGREERVEFNAHRVYNIKTILRLLKDWKLISFSFVDDNGELHKNINIQTIDLKNTYQLKWGCGIFEFKK